MKKIPVTKTVSGIFKFKRSDIPQKELKPVLILQNKFW